MNDEYKQAWTEDDPEKTDPVVEAVKAARRADAEAFADAYKNDKFDDKPSKSKKDDDEEERDSI